MPNAKSGGQPQRLRYTDATFADVQIGDRVLDPATGFTGVVQAITYDPDGEGDSLYAIETATDLTAIYTHPADHVLIAQD